METQYRYEPLAPPGNVRLLRLFPSKDENATLQGQLFDYILDGSAGQPHPYEALSYVWGTSVQTCSISIDRLKLPITANLHKALSHLRHRYLERIIWVDAICINQKDDREKEKQIRHMYEIYTCANCVIIWLGEEADESNQAFEELRIMGSKRDANSAYNEKASERVVKLLRRDWFRRIWVTAKILHDSLIAY